MAPYQALEVSLAGSRKDPYSDRCYFYFNDLHKACLFPKHFFFADGTAIVYSAPTISDLQVKICISFPKITWLHANRLSLSVHKTSYQLCGVDAAAHRLHIKVGNNELKHVATVRYLGVLIDENLEN